MYQCKENLFVLIHNHPHGRDAYTTMVEVRDEETLDPIAEITAQGAAYESSRDTIDVFGPLPMPDGHMFVRQAEFNAPAPEVFDVSTVAIDNRDRDDIKVGVLSGHPYKGEDKGFGEMIEGALRPALQELRGSFPCEMRITLERTRSSFKLRVEKGYTFDMFGRLKSAPNVTFNTTSPEINIFLDDILIPEQHGEYQYCEWSTAKDYRSAINLIDMALRDGRSLGHISLDHNIGCGVLTGMDVLKHLIERLKAEKIAGRLKLSDNFHISGHSGNPERRFEMDQLAGEFERWLQTQEK